MQTTIKRSLLRFYFCVILILSPVGVMADTQSLVSDRAEATELRSQLNAAERKLYMLECFLLILTVLYIFVYIMGRRRLMRQIWKRNRQLRSALEQANEANRMKTAFIRSMSHEIRTPLNAVNGFSQLLCSDDIELSAEERRDMRERIALNTDTITTIINELLELAEGENRNFALAPMSPNEVCRAVLEQARKHNDKQLVLTMETLVDDTLTIKSNREIVEQILTRIMDNAMKFTEVGSVTMKVERGADKQLLVSITDTGMGIPKDKHYSIFDKFVKLDDYTAGAGLGLPICRNQARMLGGDVLLDSEYEQGSRFILQLPC